MRMPVVNVRIVRVRVGHRVMAVPVGVRLSRGFSGRVAVPVMFVVLVQMRVLEGLVRMAVCVTLREV